MTTRHAHHSLVAAGVTLLHVLFERRGFRDGLAGILVFVGFRITGIEHTAGTPGRTVEREREREQREDTGSDGRPRASSDSQRRRHHGARISLSALTSWGVR